MNQDGSHALNFGARTADPFAKATFCASRGRRPPAMAANAEKLALPAADPSSYEDAAIAWASELSDLLVGRMSDGWALRCSTLTELYEAQQTESWCGYASLRLALLLLRTERESLLASREEERRQHRTALQAWSPHLALATAPSPPPPRHPTPHHRPHTARPSPQLAPAAAQRSTRASTCAGSMAARSSVGITVKGTICAAGPGWGVRKIRSRR